MVGSKKLSKVVGGHREDHGRRSRRQRAQCASSSGVPVMQLEIRNAVERDGLTYNILGILAGCIIAIIFFRKISFMVVARRSCR